MRSFIKYVNADTTFPYDIVFVYVTANECIVFNYIIHIKLYLCNGPAARRRVIAVTECLEGGILSSISPTTATNNCISRLIFPSLFLSAEGKTSKTIILLIIFHTAIAMKTIFCYDYSLKCIHYYRLHCSNNNLLVLQFPETRRKQTVVEVSLSFI